MLLLYLILLKVLGISHIFHTQNSPVLASRLSFFVFRLSTLITQLSDLGSRIFAALQTVNFHAKAFSKTMAISIAS